MLKIVVAGLTIVLAQSEIKAEITNSSEAASSNSLKE